MKENKKIETLQNVAVIMNMLFADADARVIPKGSSCCVRMYGDKPAERAELWLGTKCDVYIGFNVEALKNVAGFFADVKQSKNELALRFNTLADAMEAFRAVSTQCVTVDGVTQRKQQETAQRAVAKAM
jgi:hypothetical protein